MFHFALFAASFLAVDISESSTSSTKEYWLWKYGDDYDTKASWSDEVTDLIFAIRIIHLVVGCSQLLDMYLTSKGVELMT